MGQEDGRGRQTAEQSKVVLRHPDGVEAEFLGQQRLVQHVEQKAIRIASPGAIGWRVVGEGKVPKAHGVLLSECARHAITGAPCPQGIAATSLAYTVGIPVALQRVLRYTSAAGDGGFYQHICSQLEQVHSGLSMLDCCAVSGWKERSVWKSGDSAALAWT